MLEVNRVALFGDWVAPRPDAATGRIARWCRASMATATRWPASGCPTIAAPLGTYTGWNVYQAPFPDGELCDRDGTFVAFARTRAERLAAGDPRPSLEERYGSHAAYVARVDAAAAALVGARLLLVEDADRIRAEARRTSPIAP